jgi:hypothetical protein
MPPVLKVGNTYIYHGDTRMYDGKKCQLVDLLEYEKHPRSDSLVKIQFLDDSTTWTVHAKSLKEVL